LLFFELIFNFKMILLIWSIANASFREILRCGLVDDMITHQPVTRVLPTTMRPIVLNDVHARPLCSSRKNSSAIRSRGEEKAFIDRLSSLGSRVLLFPSLIPLKAELITDDRACLRKKWNGHETSLIFLRQSFGYSSDDLSLLLNDINEATVCH